MNAKVTPSIKLLNTKKVKNLSSLREEEDTTISKKVLEDRRSLSSRRKPKLPRRLPSNSNVPNVNKRDSYALEEPSLLNSMKRKRHNKKIYCIYF